MIHSFIRGCKLLWEGLLVPCLVIGGTIGGIAGLIWGATQYVVWMHDHPWGLLTLAPLAVAVITFIGWWEPGDRPSYGGPCPDIDPPKR